MKLATKFNNIFSIEYLLVKITESTFNLSMLFSRHRQVMCC